MPRVEVTIKQMNALKRHFSEEIERGLIKFSGESPRGGYATFEVDDVKSFLGQRLSEIRGPGANVQSLFYLLRKMKGGEPSTQEVQEVVSEDQKEA